MTLFPNPFKQLGQPQYQNIRPLGGRSYGAGKIRADTTGQYRCP